MRWECTECGFASERSERPHVCSCCGTAGGIFVEAAIGLEGDGDAESLFESWTQRGIARASAPLPPRHHRHADPRRYHHAVPARRTPE
jgi:hypothetical protein